MSDTTITIPSINFKLSESQMVCNNCGKKGCIIIKDRIVCFGCYRQFNDLREKMIFEKMAEMVKK